MKQLNIFKRITILLLVFVLTFVILNKPIYLLASTSDVHLSTEKIHAYVDLNDNFDDSSVIVVLDKNISGVNKKHDLFNDYNFTNIEDLTHVTDVTTIKDIGNFEQILKISLKYPGKENVINVINQLSLIEGIKYVGPNRILEVEQTPNDPLYAPITTEVGQWAHKNMSSEKAWDFTTGSSNVRVGVIDTGVSSHPDLTSNLASGLDFVYMDGENPGVARADSDGHGTHVAGIIGAVGNQAVPTGVVGMNWNVTIVPMQVADNSGDIIIDAIIRAINYGRDTWNTDERISILSMSIGGTTPLPDIESAIRDYPGLFICSTGNKDRDNDITHHYPSYYASSLYNNPLTNVIAVGRSDINDTRPSNANYGENTITLFAPGQNILSTYPVEFCEANPDEIRNTRWGDFLDCECEWTNRYHPYGVYEWVPNGSTHNSNGYHYMSGSSMSTPQVSGVAALILSLNPNMTTQQLKTAIVSSVDEPNIDGVNPLEDLCVTDGRLSAYGTVRYVLDNYIINLNCATSNSSLIDNCPENDSIVYKVNVKCPKSYKFISNASSPLDMTFYDSSFNEITSITPVMTNNNCTGTITTYLNPGTYYLRVNFVSGSSSGNITTSYQATWPVSLAATLNNNLNILNYLHLIDTNTYHCIISFNNIYGEKLFKFKLDAGNNATYSAGAIKVYTDSALTNQLDRYSVSGLTYPASSNVKENELYVFLPENGIYYIEITLPRNDYNSLQFLVSDVDEMSIDYLNTLATSTNTSVFSYKTEASYFKKVDISHRSKIKVELNSITGCFSNAKLFIFKLAKDPGYDIGVNHYSLTLTLQVSLDFHDDSYNTTIILNEGTYYIGYIDNTTCSLILDLRRIINTNVNMDGTLVADPYPNQGYTIGSEVLLNNGSYSNYSITEGFTRCIYLMNGNTLLEPSSRLLYDWYSSDDDVAIVTQYGTVLAKSVTSNTNVTIYAILKEDPSVVYRKTFTILNDTLTYSNAPINIYTSMTVGAGVYTPIDLSGEIVPINILQYYSWSLLQGGCVDYWGNIYANTTSLGDTLYITGEYLYNPRVKIFIDAFVTLPSS